jgi:hypothetical protein
MFRFFRVHFVTIFAIVVWLFLKIFCVHSGIFFALFDFFGYKFYIFCFLVCSAE